MSTKYVLVLCLISAIISAGLSRYYFPNVQTKTVEVTRDVIKTQIQTVTHTIQLPNGQIDTTTTTNQDTSQIITDKKQTVQLAVQKDWLISAAYNTDIHTLLPSYGADVKRRILGPIFIGGNADISGRVGLTLGMEF